MQKDNKMLIPFKNITMDTVMYGIRLICNFQIYEMKQTISYMKISMQTILFEIWILKMITIMILAIIFGEYQKKNMYESWYKSA